MGFREGGDRSHPKHRPHLFRLDPQGRSFSGFCPLAPFGAAPLYGSLVKLHTSCVALNESVPAQGCACAAYHYQRPARSLRPRGRGGCRGGAYPPSPPFLPPSPPVPYPSLPGSQAVSRDTNDDTLNRIGPKLAVEFRPLGPPTWPRHLWLRLGGLPWRAHLCGASKSKVCPWRACKVELGPPFRGVPI
jgi:hypothetical protein